MEGKRKELGGKGEEREGEGHPPLGSAPRSASIGNGTVDH